MWCSDGIVKSVVKIQIMWCAKSSCIEIRRLDMNEIIFSDILNICCQIVLRSLLIILYGPSILKKRMLSEGLAALVEILFQIWLHSLKASVSDMMCWFHLYLSLAATLFHFNLNYEYIK